MLDEMRTLYALGRARCKIRPHLVLPGHTVDLLGCLLWPLRIPVAFFFLGALALGSPSFERTFSLSRSFWVPIFDCHLAHMKLDFDCGLD